MSVNSPQQPESPGLEREILTEKFGNNDKIFCAKSHQSSAPYHSVDPGTAQSFRGLSSFRQILSACIATRLAVDTSAQLFNSFLQTVALGVSLDIIRLGRLVSLRSAIGLTAPLFGSAADRYGYRRIMRLALLLSVAGMFLIGSGAGLWSVTVGMIMSGLGLAGFVSPLQAYISEQLPFEKRARGIGMLEYSWALAGVVGLSLMGVLFERVSWQAPFFVLGTAMLGGWVLFGLLPGTPGRAGQREKTSGRSETTAIWHRKFCLCYHYFSVKISRSNPVYFLLAVASGRITDFFDLGPNRHSAYAVICANSLFFFSQLHILIAHGAWLQTEYGLNPSALGLVALCQGLGDLCGSVLVSLITDRTGKKRAVQAGMLGSFLVYSLLPMINVGLVPVIVTLVLMRFTFEYGIVSNISLTSEQAPEQRGKVMSLSMAFGLLGATISGFSGPWMYTNFGVWGLGPLAAGCTLLAFLVLTSYARERS